MIVISDGEKWYSENYTHYEPMSFSTFERFGRGEYDYAKIAQVEHYSADVCYSYFPIGLNSGIPINQKMRWCFSLTRKVFDEAGCHVEKPHSVYAYLTTEEVKTLYKDPKSIWNKADRWCEDNDDEEGDSND